MVSHQDGVTGWMRGVPVVVAMVGIVVVTAGMVVADTLNDCLTMRMSERKTARTALDREGAACGGDRQCVKDAKAKWEATAKQIDNDASACQARVRSQTKSEPPPYLHWKPGDPSPVAKDGRRYLMSCSGKVLGMYKPGGALEMELKTHPGNCMPVEGWNPVGDSAPSFKPSQPAPQQQAPQACVHPLNCPH